MEGKSKFLNINGVNTIDSAHQSQLSQVVSLSKQPPVLSAEELAVNEVYNYLQKYNGKIPNTKITENISWREMIGNDNTDEERMYECTKEILTNVYRTAQQLQKIHDIYWQGRPLIISSGWRSVRNNRINGGKSKSRHLYGKAVDFHLGLSTIKSDFITVNKYWKGFVLFEGTWIHAQRD